MRRPKYCRQREPYSTRRVKEELPGYARMTAKSMSSNQLLTDMLACRQPRAWGAPPLAALTKRKIMWAFRWKQYAYLGEELNFDPKYGLLPYPWRCSIPMSFPSCLAAQTKPKVELPPCCPNAINAVFNKGESFWHHAVWRICQFLTINLVSKKVVAKPCRHIRQTSWRNTTTTSWWLKKLVKTGSPQESADIEYLWATHTITLDTTHGQTSWMNKTISFAPPELKLWERKTKVQAL